MVDFTCARGMEQRNRRRACEERSERRDAVGSERAQCHDRSFGNGRGIACARGSVGANVGLVEDDHGRHTGLGGQRQVALETPQVEIAIETRRPGIPESRL